MRSHFKIAIALAIIGTILFSAVFLTIRISILESEVSSMKSALEDLENRMRSVERLLSQSYVVLAPYEWNVNEDGTLFSLKSSQTDKNYTAFLGLLDKAKEIGFKGIALHGVSFFYDDGLLAQALNDIEGKGLDAMLYVCWRDKTIACSFEKGNTPGSYWSVDFPLNDTQNIAFAGYLENVTMIASKFACVKGYAMFYPFINTSDYIETNMKSENYSKQLQEYVDVFKQHDTKPVYLVSDMIEDYTDALPYEISNIDGYGFTFYSKQANSTDDVRREWYWSHYQNKSKNIPDGKVLVAEWGWKTQGPSDFAYASSEEVKSDCIENMVDWASHEKAYFAYFCLHDLPQRVDSGWDWGLISNDLRLKQSGERMKQLLTDDRPP